MNTITVTEAFSNAPPRSAAVLCVRGDKGHTDLLLAEWFTWLNIKRNPMISFSLPRNDAIAQRLREGDSFVLAFPPLEVAKKYRNAVSADSENAEPCSGPETVLEDGMGVLTPKGSEVLLRCTLAGMYNYPFKKVRIFNCNLEEAKGTMENLLE